MDEAGLSRSEAIAFITNVLDLHFDENLENIRPNLLFLNTIIRAFMEVIPFQSVTLIAEDLENRHVPTWPEIKAAVFKKHGGVCHSLNAFMYFLLKSFGYDVTLGSAAVSSPDDHVIIFVRGIVKPHDLYLVDVGFGKPSFKAVCLDFETESPVFRQSFLEFKFVKEDGKIMRVHGKGDPRTNKEPESLDTVIEPWRVAFEFTIQNVRPFEEFQAFYKNTYTDINGMRFQRSLRAVAYPEGQLTAVLHAKVQRDVGEEQIQKIPLENDEAILQAYKTHFPQFEDDTVKRAIRNWRKQ